MITAKIQKAYDNLLIYCDTNGISDNFRAQTAIWQQGYWQRIYQDLVCSGAVERISKASVMDVGSKYGHMTPLLVSLGAAEVLCVDVEDEYLSVGRQHFQKLYGNVSFSKSDRGFIAIQPDRADVVLSIEILSHANLRFTEVIYSEYARILKMGGMLVLADGNNLAQADYFNERLVDLYEKWENGPDGVIVENTRLDECFRSIRKRIIKEHCPVLDAERLDYLATNTSGLFGTILMEVVEHYMLTGELIRRPYRRGICPTNPIASGVHMEKGLFPDEVMLALSIYGITCLYVQRELHKKSGSPLETFVEGDWFTIAGVKVF